MYSPKISENLIPDLFRIKTEMKVPMTDLVNYIIKDYLRRLNREKNSHALGGDGSIGSAG